MYFSATFSLPRSILTVVAYIFADYKVYNDVFEREVSGVNPYLTGISVFLGLYAFDLSGILYGPLLICMVHICYDLLSKITVNENNQLEFQKVNRHRSLRRVDL